MAIHRVRLSTGARAGVRESESEEEEEEEDDDDDDPDSGGSEEEKSAEEKEDSSEEEFGERGQRAMKATTRRRSRPRRSQRVTTERRSRQTTRPRATQTRRAATKRRAARRRAATTRTLKPRRQRATLSISSSSCLRSRSTMALAAQAQWCGCSRSPRRRGARISELRDAVVVRLPPLLQQQLLAASAAAAKGKGKQSGKGSTGGPSSRRCGTRVDLQGCQWRCRRAGGGRGPALRRFNVRREAAGSGTRRPRRDRAAGVCEGLCAGSHVSGALPAHAAVLAGHPITRAVSYPVVLRPRR